MAEPSPFGSARTANASDVSARFGRVAKPSFFLGRHFDPEADTAGAEIVYSGERHLLVFGPNGSGKGARLLIPNLLRSFENQSVIVIDPKGEIAAVTADWRRRQGHNVVILNPFNVLGFGSAGFNPLSGLDPESPNFYDNAAAIGEALIKIEGQEPHWSESAQGLIVGLLMWEKLRNGDRANLENVRQMLTEAAEWKTGTKDGITYRVQVKGLRTIAAEMVEKGGYEIASLASRFTEETNELASIRSTADTQTRWLLSPPMRADLKKDGVDFTQLKSRPTTVYVVLPSERLRTHSIWLRLVIVSALRSLYRPGGLRTVMLIDEMAALGHLAPLEDAFGLVRGYGVQVAAVFQDLSQLKALYKERWETFVANAGVVFGFAPNDLTTADWMSKRSGQATVVAKSFSLNRGESIGGHHSNSEGMSSSDQQIARPVFLPDELFGLEEGTGLIWIHGLQHTVRFFAPFYSMIAECEGRDQPNPYRSG